MNVKEKIEQRLNDIERMMKEGAHLHSLHLPELQSAIENVTKFWSYLSWDEREFLNCVRDAIDDQLEWK